MHVRTVTLVSAEREVELFEREPAHSLIARVAQKRVADIYSEAAGSRKVKVNNRFPRHIDVSVLFGKEEVKCCRLKMIKHHLYFLFAFGVG